MAPRLFLRALIAVSLGFAALPVGASSASEPLPERSAERVDGRYIVVFRASVDRPGALSDRLEEAEGFETDLRYRHALEGFAAGLSPSQVGRLRQDPRVAFVVADRKAHALGIVPLASGDVAPTGVRRIEAASLTEAHEASSVNVAVIDTGIDLGHADLNSINGKDCTGAEPAQDDNGHGTHVAGTIAAENDGSRVVGVAPGNRVYAVKVLNNQGSGTWSQIICGIDWVTGTRADADPSNDIAIANMSLGGGGPPVQACATTTDAMHKAICRSTAAGVTYVVAAGNSGWDFDYPPQPDVPAVYPEVLTVTAMSDSDGLAGGIGGPTCRSSDSDDRHASFSNYAKTAAGQQHTVAGPGVCITSDWPGGGTATISGTSMASPHIAGLVALCIGEAGAPGECAGLTPAQIIQKVRDDAAAFNASTSTYGFTGDPIRPISGRYYGYLARVGMAPTAPPPPDETPPTVVSTNPPHGATGVSPTTTVSVTFDDRMDRSSAQAAFSLSPPAAGTFSWSGSMMTFRPGADLARGTSYTATVTTAAKNEEGLALQADHVWSFQTLATVTAFPDGTTIESRSGTPRGGSASSLGLDDNSYYEVNSTTTGTRTTSWYGSFQGVSNGLAGLKVTYKGKASIECTQTVSIWDWGRGAWTQLDSRSVSSRSESLVESSPGGTLGSYVSGASGDGELRVRVRCTRNSTFYSSGDLMKIAYTIP